MRGRGPAPQPSKTLGGGGSYDGSWLGGRFCGEGTHTDAEGGVWSGRWWCGLRHGAGSSGGGALTGQWRAGAPSDCSGVARMVCAKNGSILRWLPPAVAAADDAEADDSAGVPATFDGRVVGHQGQEAALGLKLGHQRKGVRPHFRKGV